MHFKYLQLDIFTLINIIYLKHVIIYNSMTLSVTPSPPPHIWPYNERCGLNINIVFPHQNM